MRRFALVAVLALATACGATRTTTAPRIGVAPFWYMRTIGTMRAPRCAKPLPGVMNPCRSTVWFDVVMSTETWVGVDGTMRERSVEVSQRFASPDDRARWAASHKPVPIPISVAQGDVLDIGSRHFPPPPFGTGAPDAPPAEGPPAGAGPIDVGDGVFTYEQLLALPTAGAAARARIDRAWTALRHRAGRMLERWHSPGAAVIARGDLGPLPRAGRAIQELTLIADLDAAPIAPRVRLALFHAAAGLPGTTIRADVSGGVNVVASYPHWGRTSFTFDPDTGELLSGPPMDGGPPDVPGPDSTVTAQGPVASITSLPEGVRPIDGVGKPPLWPSPPAPAAETISPATGRPSTVFTVRLVATAGERAHPAPTGWLGVTGSAGNGIYPGPGPDGARDPCLPRSSVRIRPATTTHQNGRLVYVYRIGPGMLHLRTWCAGRYRLGIQTFPNPLPPHYTTPPYTGPSGTSIYFEVSGRGSA